MSSFFKVGFMGENFPWRRRTELQRQTVAKEGGGMAKGGMVFRKESGNERAAFGGAGQAVEQRGSGAEQWPARTSGEQHKRAHGVPANLQRIGHSVPKLPDARPHYPSLTWRRRTELQRQTERDAVKPQAVHTQSGPTNENGEERGSVATT